MKKSQSKLTRRGWNHLKSDGKEEKNFSRSHLSLQHRSEKLCNENSFDTKQIFVHRFFFPSFFFCLPLPSSTFYVVLCFPSLSAFRVYKIYLRFFFSHFSYLWIYLIGQNGRAEYNVMNMATSIKLNFGWYERPCFFSVFCDAMEFLLEKKCRDRNFSMKRRWKLVHLPVACPARPPQNLI